MIDRNLYIERIIKRYLDLNKQDYAEGLINSEVKSSCDKSAENFKAILDKLTDGELASFYALDKRIQIKVFSWDSACNQSIYAGQEAVKQVLSIVNRDMNKTGYGEIPAVEKIMSIHESNLYRFVTAKYEVLPNDCAVYHFNNN